MSTSSCDQLVNRGYCLQCRKSVPVKRVQREDCLYLLHECPECGPTEQLLSRDAKKYYAKRELVNYQGEAEKTCSMNCVGCWKRSIPPPSRRMNRPARAEPV